MDMENFNWYPGHMRKAALMIRDDLKLVDLVIELLDARAVNGSRNPDIDALCANKDRIIVLNKADLADDAVSDGWIRYFKSRGINAIKLNSLARGKKDSVIQALQAAAERRLRRNRTKGILNRPVRAMAVGIPNVGKSTLINMIAGRSSAKTGDKPGVTRGRQWIRLNSRVELLDTPGILWPKQRDKDIVMHLAATGAVKDDLIIPEEVASWLLTYLHREYPGRISVRYDIDEDNEPQRLLYDIAGKKGCKLKGNEADTEKAARLVINDFRGGRMGRVSLEVA